MPRPESEISAIMGRVAKARGSSVDLPELLNRIVNGYGGMDGFVQEYHRTYGAVSNSERARMMNTLMRLMTMQAGAMASEGDDVEVEDLVAEVAEMLGVAADQMKHVFDGNGEEPSGDGNEEAGSPGE